MRRVCRRFTRNCFRMQQQNRGAGLLKRIVVAGSAPAPSDGRLRAARRVGPVWGMTETSHVRDRRSLRAAWRGNATARAQDNAGPAGGVDIKVADENGAETARRKKRTIDGARAVDSQRLLSREKPLLEDGWFNTGDRGDRRRQYVQLADRADVIKSGGEWISSIDVENLAGVPVLRRHP